MTKTKKREVNHKLRQLQLELHRMHDEGLILYKDVQELTSAIQEKKYDLAELEE